MTLTFPGSVAVTQAPEKVRRYRIDDQGRLHLIGGDGAELLRASPAE